MRACPGQARLQQGEVGADGSSRARDHFVESNARSEWLKLRQVAEVVLLKPGTAWARCPIRAGGGRSLLPGTGDEMHLLLVPGAILLAKREGAVVVGESSWRLTIESSVTAARRWRASGALYLKGCAPNQVRRCEPSSDQRRSACPPGGAASTAHRLRSFSCWPNTHRSRARAVARVDLRLGERGRDRPGHRAHARVAARRWSAAESGNL